MKPGALTIACGHRRLLARGYLYLRYAMNARDELTATTTIFLLSPAFCGGRRAAILLNPRSAAVTSQAFRLGRLTLGDAFAFMSGLYFRGKLTYATRFGRAYVITPTRGLQPPSMPFNLALLREFAVGDVSLANPIYRT